MATVEYSINPRFVSDDVPLWFGNAKDGAVVYDATSDELTLQTRNAAGTLTDRLAIKANTDTPTVVWNEGGVDMDYRWETFGNASSLFLEGSSGNLLLARNTALAPDTQLHVWASGAGTVSAITNTVVTIERSGAAYIDFLMPAANGGGLHWSNPTVADAAEFIFNSNTNEFWLYVGGTNRLKYGANSFAFQETTSIKVGANQTLTLDATAGTTGKVQITADQLGFFGVTPVARASAYTPTNVTTERAYDADATAVAELADVLGTLIADLQAYGLLQ